LTLDCVPLAGTLRFDFENAAQKPEYFEILISLFYSDLQESRILARRLQTFIGMIKDFSFALRRLWRSPGFAATAIATLAICVGANLAIFAVVDAVLIRPLPYPQSDRLVTMYYVYPKVPSAVSGASLTNYYERRGKIPAFSSIAEIQESTSVIGETGATSIEKLGRVTPDFFDTIGVKPLMGRAFKESELTYQTDNEAVLSYEAWKDWYGSDPNILGKLVRSDGIPRTIVGVLPPSFQFLDFRALVYMPLSSEDGERNVGARHNLGKTLVGRLTGHSTVAEAVSELAALDAAIAPSFPDAKVVADSGCHTVVEPLHADYVARVRPVLLLLQAGAALLLVIGCANLINLLLIRSSDRAREFAIRQALGATSGHLLRDTMTEALILAGVGGLLGVCAGLAGTRLLATLGEDRIPFASEASFDWKFAIVSIACAIGSGIAIGAPVAWLSLRSRIVATLHSESRTSTAGRSTQKLRNGFIVAQVALAFVLLTGASLLGLSLKHAMEVNPGFVSDHVVTGRMSLTWKGYHDLPSFGRFFDRVLERTQALPGVKSVGVTSQVPTIGTGTSEIITVVGYTPPRGEIASVHDRYAVAGDYFQAMGIPLVAGRFLTEEDCHRNDRVCVVDKAFAEQYWPGADPLGRTLYPGSPSPDHEEPFRVVGVVGVVKQTSLTESMSRGGVYMPYTFMFARGYFLAVRTAGDPGALGKTLSRIVRTVDPEMPLTDIRTMDVRIHDGLAGRRSPAFMAGLFAVTAFLLAAVGLYGVMAYSVAQRTREFGVRLALGARPSDILQFVFWHGIRLAVLGLCVGVASSAALMGYLSSFLYGLTAANLPAYTLVSVALVAMSGAACILPAVRATRVDPIVALRSD
jgi:predicted permease